MVQESSQPEGGNVCEAPCKHFGPRLDGLALRVPESLEVFLQQPPHAFPGGMAVALLQRAEQRPVHPFGKSVPKPRQRLVHQFTSLGGLEQAGLPVDLRLTDNFVHADARQSELAAGAAVDVFRYGHIDEHRWLPGGCLRGDPFQSGFSQQRFVGAGSTEYGLHSRRIAQEVGQRHGRGGVGLRRRPGLGRCSIDEYQRCIRFSQRACRALGHRGDAHECHGAGRAFKPLAESRHCQLGQRYASLAEAGCTPDLCRNAQGLGEEQFQPRAAQPQFGCQVAAGSHLPDDLDLPDRGGIQPGRHQEQVFAGAFSLPGPERAFGLARFRCMAQEEFVDRWSQVDVACIVCGCAGAARENELDAVAGIQIGELCKTGIARERAQAFFAPLPGKREACQRLATVLAPGDADNAQFVQHADKIRDCDVGIVTGVSRCMPASSCPRFVKRYTWMTVPHKNCLQHRTQEETA